MVKSDKAINNLKNPHQYKFFSQSSLCIFFLLFLCVHPDRVCALLCDPDTVCTFNLKKSLKFKCLKSKTNFYTKKILNYPRIRVSN